MSLPPALAPDALVLVADIGGTNSRVGMARDGQVLRPGIRRFANAGFASPGALLRAYLADRPAPAGAVVAIAGTLRDGVAEMSNLDWSLSLDGLHQATGATQLRLLNDLQAQGYALDHLRADQCAPILPAPGAPGPATRLVVGIGTGFNASPVHRLASGTFVPPAEAGHAPLPLDGPQEQALAAHLAREGTPPIVEALLSGPGLARAYRFFAPQAPPLAPQQVVGAAASDPAARQALALFIRLLGRVIGNLAWSHLPLGGVFLSGGVARAIAPHLPGSGFAREFGPGSRFQARLGTFPVMLVVDDHAALTGCARVLQG